MKDFAWLAVAAAMVLGRPLSSDKVLHLMSLFEYEVCVVGGCGRVGLPLAITFADSGLNVSVYDINRNAVETVRSGRMPFLEEGCRAGAESRHWQDAERRQRSLGRQSCAARDRGHRHAG